MGRRQAVNTYERLLEVNAKIRKERMKERLTEGQKKLIARKNKADEIAFMRELSEIEMEYSL